MKLVMFLIYLLLLSSRVMAAVAYMVSDGCFWRFPNVFALYAMQCKII